MILLQLYYPLPPAFLPILLNDGKDEASAWVAPLDKHNVLRMINIFKSKEQAKAKADTFPHSISDR